MLPSATITVGVCEVCIDLHRLPDEGVFEGGLCVCCKKLRRSLFAVKVSVPPHRGAA